MKIVKSFSDPDHIKGLDWRWGLGEDGRLYFATVDAWNFATDDDWIDYVIYSRNAVGVAPNLSTIIKIAQEFQELYQFYASFR